jgi:cytochrome P450
MDRLLSKEERQHHLDDQHLAYVGGVMMEAASDTTSSTLYSFVLAMVKNPRVLKKAQKEVDNVCGDSRSPTYEDTPSLLYIRTCVYEVGSLLTDRIFTSATDMKSNRFSDGDLQFLPQFPMC